MNLSYFKKVVSFIFRKDDASKLNSFNNTLFLLTCQFKSEIGENLKKDDQNKNFIEIYKSYFSYIQSIQAGRWKQHTFYFALYSILAYSILRLYTAEVTCQVKIIHTWIQSVLSVFLVIISCTWLINLRHIQKELKIKYTFMQSMETFLPVRLFYYEFRSAAEAALKVNSNYEIIFITSFLILSIISLILSIILLVLLYKGEAGINIVIV